MPETARYRILDGDDIKGSGVLSIEARGDALIFSQSFQSQEQVITDDISVETDATTLQPLTVRRVIAGPEGERVCDANYAGGSAVVTQRAKDDERIDKLDVPAPSYDSWTDLFLWRTLPFAQGYEATYTDILTCSLAKPDVLSVEIKSRGSGDGVRARGLLSGLAAGDPFRRADAEGLVRGRRGEHACPL